MKLRCRREEVFCERRLDLRQLPRDPPSASARQSPHQCLGHSSATACLRARTHLRFVHLLVLLTALRLWTYRPICIISDELVGRPQLFLQIAVL